MTASDIPAFKPYDSTKLDERLLKVNSGLRDKYRKLIGNRQTLYVENMGSNYNAEFDERVEVPEDEANLVSSRELGSDMHRPVIDIDFPCSLVPSGTPDHFHLYLDKPMTWRAYKRLLAELYKTGIVEKGFYELSVKRGASFVRHPNHPKGTD
jgi:hypothetical protein